MACGAISEAQLGGADGISSFLSKSVSDSTLQPVCDMSFQLIQDATRGQINAAVKYNKDNINRLLIKLMAINFITNNQKEITQEIHSNGASTSSNVNLKEYCEKKLLSISPVMGFSRKDYFGKYNISDSVECEIVSYLHLLWESSHYVFIFKPKYFLFQNNLACYSHFHYGLRIDLQREAL